MKTVKKYFLYVSHKLYDYSTVFVRLFQRNTFQMVVKRSPFRTRL